MTTRTIVALVLGLAVAAPAYAAPLKKRAAPVKKFTPKKKSPPSAWAPVKTAAFDMALPKEFFLVGETIANPKKPWFGSWRFATEGARRKMFIRVAPMTNDSLDKLLDKSLENIKRRAGELTTLGKSEATDDAKSPFLVGFYQATLNARNTKTKKVEPRPHLVVRLVQQYPEVKTQVFVTYLFTSSKFDAGREFVAEHTRQLHFHHTKAKLDAIQKLGARFPRAGQFVKPHKWGKQLEQKVKFLQHRLAAEKPAK